MENAEAEDTLSNAERRQGALIARVEMRVAGTTRTVPRKIMTSPDEPGKYLLVQRNAQTGKLEPLMRRDRVRPFGRDIDGVWRNRNRALSPPRKQRHQSTTADPEVGCNL